MRKITSVLAERGIGKSVVLLLLLITVGITVFCLLMVWGMPYGQ